HGSIRPRPLARTSRLIVAEHHATMWLLGDPESFSLGCGPSPDQRITGRTQHGPRLLREAPQQVVSEELARDCTALVGQTGDELAADLGGRDLWIVESSIHPREVLACLSASLNVNICKIKPRICAWYPCAVSAP